MVNEANCKPWNALRDRIRHGRHGCVRRLARWERGGAQKGLWEKAEGRGGERWMRGG